MADFKSDLDNLFYFLYMENEEKRYQEEQKKKLEEIVVENKTAFGREEDHL